MKRKRSYFPVEISNEEKNFNHWKALVSEVFINAVLAHDSDTIKELAEAAKFFKGKIGVAGVDFEADNPVWHKLLKIKSQPRMFPSRFTMRQIAEQVYSKEMVLYYTAEGFSALRAQCKKIGIHIVPEKRKRK